ncbi:MAG: PTS sugar transporter subunit IIA [Clostridiaceae bacterium]|nr:PTS sugar transporter subunit IIA [Clostridiaceae bacterium]
MSTKDMFSSNRVCFNLKATTKKQVIDELIEMLVQDGKLTNEGEFKEAVLRREEEASTSIGMGIAIPHGKSSSVIKASIVFGKSQKGIQFDSMDEEPTYLFFLMAAPHASGDVHLRDLSEISEKLMNSEVRTQLNKANSLEELINAFCV